VAAENIES